MQALATFIMASRLRAVTATSGLAAVGMILPPVGILSGAGLALVGLRVGPGQALAVMAASAAVLGGLLWLAAGTPLPALVVVAMQWLPVVGLGFVLRATASWATTLQAGAAVAGGLVLMVHALVPDVGATWTGVLEQTFGPLLGQSGMTPEDAEALMAGLVPMMTGIAAAGALLGLVLALMVGRYWQSLLYNPGGFGSEFRALNLGRTAAVAFVVLVVAAWLGGTGLAGELAAVLAVAFLFQGFALVHAICHHKQLSQLWLVGMYVLLVPAMPQMLLLLVTLGAVDGMADFRRHVTEATGGGQ